MKYPWDTTFNRALNIKKGKPANEPPEYGRVVGAGDGATWTYYYHEDKETRRQRRKLGQVSIQEQVAQAVRAATSAAKEEAKTEAVEAAKVAAREEFGAQWSAALPALVKWMRENPDQEFPVPSFVGSGSVNIAATPAPAPAHSSPSSVYGILGGASTLAELNALTVITRRTLLNIFNLPILCLNSDL